MSSFMKCVIARPDPNVFEALFALADRIEAPCTAARAQAQRLTPLALAKAFRGELMPHDPSDEPASALLAHIALSNTGVAGKNKRKVTVACKKRALAAINLRTISNASASVQLNSPCCMAALRAERYSANSDQKIKLMTNS